MSSLVAALKSITNREVAIWLNHIEFKVLTGRLTEVQDEHLVLRVADSAYYIPYHAIVAVRPNA